MNNIINSNSSMVLFSDPNGFESHMVRFVLLEKGVAADIIDVDPNDKPKELADFNPYNATPTLLDRELVLYHINVILEYLEDRFPHPPLMPAIPIAKAENRLWTKRIFDDIATLVRDIQTSSSRKVAKSRKDLADILISVSPIFKEKPFFMSDDMTLSDCVLAPLLWRLPVLKVELPKIKAKPMFDYMDRMFELETFQKSLSEAEKTYN